MTDYPSILVAFSLSNQYELSSLAAEMSLEMEHQKERQAL